MKNINWLLLPVLLVAGIMFVLVSPKKLIPINRDFSRQYAGSGLSCTNQVQTSYNIDIISVAGKGFAGYSMEQQRVVELDSVGKITRSIPFIPLSEISFLHSLSFSNGSLYGMGINDKKIFCTRFDSGWTVAGNLLPGTLGIVKIPGGYMTLCNTGHTTGLFYHRENGGPDSLIFRLEDYGDRGLSHMGQLINSCDERRSVYIPYYNSRIVVFDHVFNRVVTLRTVEQQPVRDLSISSGRNRILSSKAPVVNRKGAASDKYLFVLSYARSEKDSFPDAIVDVYELDKLRYSCSLRITGLTSSDITAFTCTNEYLVFSKADHLMFYAIHEKDIHP